jgi:hypothetical protein
MPPEHLRFGGGLTETALNPLVAVYLFIAIVLILTLPRRKAIIPFLFAFFTIPIGQVVVLWGFHFTGLRILILGGLVRRTISGLTSSESKYPGRFNSVDLVVLLFSISALMAFSLEFMQMQAVINGMGSLLDILGGYLVVRFLIPDGEAVRRTIKTLAAVCVVNGVCMINEQISHVNVFGLLGGIPIAVATREGHLRSSGVMGYLWAGVFGGVLIPVFVWLWTDGKSRMIALAGIAGAMAMAITSYSSTSLMALMGSFLGLAFWPLRRQMRAIRWGFVMMLVALQMVMKAPVWALIARVDLVGGSSGYQRYMLVDMCIRHFSDWWLLGTSAYVSWGWDSWDLCNQFVLVALTGGLLTLIFYIAIFQRSFSAIGTARKMVNGDRKQEWFLWCLGSTLFANVVAHFGINYLAQLIMGLLPMVVCISVATFEAKPEPFQSVEIPAKLVLVPTTLTAEANLILDRATDAVQGSHILRSRERLSSD